MNLWLLAVLVLLVYLAWKVTKFVLKLLVVIGLLIIGFLLLKLKFGLW